MLKNIREIDWDKVSSQEVCTDCLLETLIIFTVNIFCFKNLKSITFVNVLIESRASLSIIYKEKFQIY